MDTSYIYENIRFALTKNKEGHYEEAYKSINKLQFELQGKQVRNFYLALTYLNKGKIEINLGNYEEAIQSSKKALDVFLSEADSLKIADSYNLIGVGFYFLSNYDSAQAYYDKSYQLKKDLGANNKELAISSYNQAIIYEDLAKSQEALRMYKQAEHYLLQNKEENSFLSDIYVGMAHLNFSNKDISEAEKYADMAMEVGMKVYGEFHPNMTFVYTTYANILESKKKYKESILLIQKGLKIREEKFGANHRWTCESNYDLANAYVLDGQYIQAEKYYLKAIEIAKRINSQNNLAIAKTYLAKLYIDQNIKLNEAEELLLDALDYKLTIFGKENEGIAEIYNVLSKKAMLNNDNAYFKYLTNEALRSSRYIKSNIENTIAPEKALETMILKSTFNELNYKETNEVKFLEENYGLIDSELNLIKYMQKKSYSERSRIHIANNYRSVYENSLNTCWELYYKSNKNSVYLDKAFEVSEANRNFTLLEGLKNTQFKKFAKIPDELLNIEKETRQSLAQIELKLYNEKKINNPDKQILGLLLDQRILISNKLDSLQIVFETNFPKYTNLKYENKLVNFSDVKNDLDNHTQVISYFLGDKNLYTFNITKNNVIFLKGNIARKIKDNILTLKYDLLNQNAIDKSTKELYLYLLAQQIDLSKRKIVIISDNVLNYIPFEILQNENNESLIENFTVSYSGSTRLFLELNNKFFDYELPNYWVGFSPEYNSGKSLNSNMDEISEISEIINGHTFLGNNSNINNFLKNANKNSIIHLAMHSEIDNDEPLYNKLIFSDGELTSSEIYVSDIRANLAVLSACNTGFGKLEMGEGIMSMARAFNYSGVPSILMSLWKVPDKETKKIMVSFYNHLKDGEPKNVALKNAKLEYLASTTDKNLRHPYYWSGFVLNGNTDSLGPSKDRKFYFISGILLFGSIIIGLRIKK